MKVKVVAAAACLPYLAYPPRPTSSLCGRFKLAETLSLRSTLLDSTLRVYIIFIATSKLSPGENLLFLTGAKTPNNVNPQRLLESLIRTQTEFVASSRLLAANFFFLSLSLSPSLYPSLAIRLLLDSVACSAGNAQNRRQSARRDFGLKVRDDDDDNNNNAMPCN